MTMSNKLVFDAFVEKTKVDINQELKLGFTPLIIAVQNGLEAAVYALLEKNADITKKNYLGKTALDIASELAKVTPDGPDKWAYKRIVTILTNQSAKNTPPKIIVLTSELTLGIQNLTQKLKVLHKTLLIK